ncbi:hypothetical protein BDV26DRAFT_275247 [Aspergillus bertholletiae]|uniref:Transcription factor domain-containing protein n=1 Tax=Aspergillus bertholletiae TaxID=1226010 RepID=A0A5N7APU4_9EURO|nr:hypothetical protein BDV26DRAFT_275247 [Aspergillus bertholletiae]
MVIGSGTLVEAQCLFLCGVYMMTSFQRHVAWKFFIQTLACCQSFKFLRDLSTGKGRLSAFPQGNDYPTYDTQTQQSLQAEQAIYWSAWKSERELREDIQAPDFAPSKTELAIYPPFFPTPPLLQDRSATRTGLVGLEYRQQISWYFYLSEISLRRLLSRITNQIVQFRPSGVPLLEGLAQMTVVHEAQAEEWALALPQILSLDCHPEEDEICRFVLRGHLINLYELIYWPFVYAAVNNADFDSEKQPAPQSSVLIRSLCRKGLQKHVERLWVNRPGFKHRHHGTPALLRSCSRSALVLVAAAASIQTRLRQGLSSSFTMPHGWRQAVLWAVEMNEFWEGESTDSQYLAGLLKVAWGKVEPSNL